MMASRGSCDVGPGVGLREMKSAAGVLALSLSFAALGGCADYGAGFRGGPYDPVSSWSVRSSAAPPPKRKATAAIYFVKDRTGKFTFGLFGPDLERMLAHGLRRAGGGAWFEVVDPGGFEESAIRSGGSAHAARPKAALRIGCVVTRMESSIDHGGKGAALLGVAPDFPYWRLSVALTLWATDIFTGKSLGGVAGRETLYAVPLRGGGFKYASAAGRLPAGTGVAKGGLTEMAARGAIDAAIHGLALRGASRGLWTFPGKPARRRKKIVASRSPAKTSALKTSALKTSAPKTRPPVGRLLPPPRAQING
jgi:hypothetical protein